MANSMNRIEKEFVTLVEHLGALSGLPPGLSSLFAFVYIQKEPVPMDEVSSKVGYSLGSVSIKVDQLERIGLIKKLKKPGSKKVYLYVHKQLWIPLFERMISNKERNISLVKKHLPAIISRFSGMKLTAEEKTQLKYIKMYYRQTLKMEKLLNKIKALVIGYEKG